MAGMREEIGELREERDALKRDQEMLFTGIKVANAQQAEALERAEHAESALREAQAHIEKLISGRGVRR